ncbi:hypothetical protein CSZ94_07925 [Janthinobacterium sp. ROICE36]|nr:hypothetical protein CSZ94_07925 [Janthinobacterium sp. ROICE36]
MAANCSLAWRNCARWAADSCATAALRCCCSPSFSRCALLRQLRLAARQLLLQAIAGRRSGSSGRALGFQHFQLAARLLQLRRDIAQLGPQALFHALPLLSLRLGGATGQQHQQ